MYESDPLGYYFTILMHLTECRSYLQPSLSGAEIYKVFLVESPPGEKGLGVVISNKEGEGCLIMKVTPHCPFSDKVQVGDRYLTLNN